MAWLADSEKSLRAHKRDRWTSCDGTGCTIHSVMQQKRCRSK